MREIFIIFTLTQEPKKGGGLQDFCYVPKHIGGRKLI